MKFETLGLPAPLLQALTKMQFTTPTPIQEQAIPLALAGRDILGSAQTGTGKTGAFGIPLIARLLEAPQAMAIILTPTRELAGQVLAALQQMIPHDKSGSAIKSALLIGGEPMPRQFKQLQARPRLIVGTPGRVNDHLLRGTLKLNTAGFLVLDETDRMLDMGFGVQIEKIVQHMPSSRQTLMFSATMPPAIVKLAGKYMNNPERISVGSTSQAAPNVKQELIQLKEEEKYDVLLEKLDQSTGTTIVFVKTKFGAERMAKKLAGMKYLTDALHGDLKQSRRDRVIQAYRDRKFRILIATDVAARGLDISHIELVINYDMPQCPEDYIHRVGRTARAGAEGVAINLLTSADRGKWRAIQQLMNPGAKVEFERTAGESKGGKKPYRGGKPSGKFSGGYKGANQNDRPQGERQRKPFHRGQTQGRKAASR